MSSLPASETCGTTTGIKLVYDPESQKLFKQGSNGDLVLSDLQLASIQTQGITEANRLDTQQMQQYIETPAFFESTHGLVRQQYRQTGHFRNNRNSATAMNMSNGDAPGYMTKTQPSDATFQPRK